MIYLISYNHSQTNFDSKVIHQTMTHLPGAIDWWHYLPEIYLVDTSSSASTIANSIIAKHPGLLFIVVKVDLSHHNGVLNKDAWEWINRKTRTILKLKPATPPAPLSFLPPISSKPTSSPNMSITELIKKLSEGQ